MMPHWTTEHVNAFAPDSSSLKNGQSLAIASKWQTLGQKDGILWGEIKGSGSKPYQTCIEQATPSFKCSCPSRKFPCKHGLGLAFIYVAQADALKTADYPDWVAEWLNKREQSAQRKVEKNEQPVDAATLKKREQAQQKRQSAREDKISAGVGELQTWLYDRVRQGLSAAAEDTRLWDKMAARMIDAQAAGLAQRLQYCSTLRFRVPNWQEKLLREVARLHLLLEAYQRRDTLPENLQADIAMHIGETSNKAELLEKTGITDNWQVVGQAQEEKDTLRIQRTWLYGKQQNRYALLLDFAIANQAMTLRPPLGSCFNAELVFYPNSYEIRALIKQDNSQLTESAVCAELVEAPCRFMTVSNALTAFHTQLTHSPWLNQYPFSLTNVIPIYQNGLWLLVDNETRTTLPLNVTEAKGWHLLTLSGGHPINIFAEWDGEALTPLAV